MDAHNENEFASQDALKYWENVDLYIGGSEHATGHLLYSRFWNKFLKDKGFAPTEEPFKKLINQGMILGMSAFVYRAAVTFSGEGFGFDFDIDWTKYISKYVVDRLIPAENNLFKSDDLFEDFKKVLISGIRELGINNIIGEELVSHFDLTNLSLDEQINIFKKHTYFCYFKTHVDVSMVNSSDELNIEAFKNWREDYANAQFITEDNGKFIVGREIEKMSKSKYNVVTPDLICAEYGADTLRLYEMFLGPLEQAKPWNTAGISGVFGFLKKLCRLYFDDNGLIVTDNEPSKESLKTLHKTIKKVAEDIESFSFNTSVSQFMICVNELSTQNCHERAILEPLAILISPYAPHIAEELWSLLGHSDSISTVAFPKFEAAHLVESSKEYPVSFNGKMRFTMELPLDLTKEQIEEIVMKDERTLRQLDGRTPNKVIIVPGKIINLVG
jgi:leucyl-tRNA synthetase